MIIDIIVTVMRTSRMLHITGKSDSFGKVLPSGTYNPFVVSILNPISSLAKGFENSTPAATEMQESTEHIYFSIQTQPTNTPNSVSPV